MSCPRQKIILNVKNSLKFTLSGKPTPPWPFRKLWPRKQMFFRFSIKNTKIYGFIKCLIENRIFLNLRFSKVVKGLGFTCARALPKPANPPKVQISWIERVAPNVKICLSTQDLQTLPNSRYPAWIKKLIQAWTFAFILTHSSTAPWVFRKVWF